LAEGPDTLWTQRFDNQADDYGGVTLPTEDGGYVILATSMNLTWVIKTDLLGNVEWERELLIGVILSGNMIRQTNDGGYILTGRTNAGEDPYEYDVALIKLSGNGSTIWSKVFSYGSLDNGLSVIQTSDGGYLVIGDSSVEPLDPPDVILLKTDSEGHLLWVISYGDENEEEYANDVVETFDGDYVIAGVKDPSDFSNFSAWILKVDSDGDFLWEIVYGTVDNTDMAYKIVETLDGNYIVAGETLQTDPMADVWLLKIGGSGEMLWAKTFVNLFRLTNLSITPSGEFLLCGYKPLDLYSGNYYVLKTSAGGIPVWEKTLPGAGFSSCNSAYQTLDGGYILGGNSNSFDESNTDLWIVKLDQD